jgi:hypothetical protein
LARALPDERVLDALDRAPTRGRATAADVAALGGLSLADAKAGLVLLTTLLAADKDTRMEVDADGDVAFGFAPNVRAAVARASRASRWRNRWQRAKPYLEKGGKTLFGIGLVVNVATVWAMVAALQASTNKNNDDRGSQSSYGGGGSFMAFRLLDVIDLLRFRDRMTYYDAAFRGEAPPEYGTLDGIYSYVFGDGDPNQGLPQEQLRLAAAAIRNAGGAVAAEELAPFCLVPPPLDPFAGAVDIEAPDGRTSSAISAMGSSSVVNEQWVLPVVLALGGVPEVTDAGDIVYLFDDLLSTATAQQEDAPSLYDASGGSQGWPSFYSSSSSRSRSAASLAMVEEEVPFSRAPKTALYPAAALGVADAIGVGMLGSMLVERGLLASMGTAFWPLAAYAALVNALPLARYFKNKRGNAQIAERNEARALYAQQLAEARAAASFSPASAQDSAFRRARGLASGAVGGAAAALARKIRGARELGARRLLGGGDSGRKEGRDGGAALKAFGSGGLAYATDDGGAALAAEGRRAADLAAFDKLLGPTAGGEAKGNQSVDPADTLPSALPLWGIPATPPAAATEKRGSGAGASS